MAKQTRSTFPLRLRSEQVRALVKAVAEREQVSQNELIEQAVEHELVLRGAMLADDLELAAARLHVLIGANEYQALVEKSLRDAGAGEGQAEPIPARALHAGPDTQTPVRFDFDPEQDPLGALSAFHDASR